MLLALALKKNETLTELYLGENEIGEYQIGMWERAYSAKGVILVDDPKYSQE